MNEEQFEGTQVRPYAVPWREGLRRAVYVRDLGSLLALLACRFMIDVQDIRDLKQRYFGYDKQTGWTTWIVTFRGNPILWSNGPLPGVAELHVVKRQTA